MYSINLLELLIGVLLASFGGIVKRLVDIEKNPNNKISRSQYITGATISMFVGIVMYTICKNYNLDPLMTISLVSIAGFFGAPVMILVADLSFKKIRIISKESFENFIIDTIKDNKEEHKNEYSNH